ncbi:essential meiotic structure-specific endonuclease subunit 2 [Denticeps clupeoides]|uniref:ERCC4 domain-containing protein n=1 Tax=Denticeps clupeoides TaxID=299321 RepID=A0AAY4EK07_9TELE|nr:probable crossover junction endonuclease EME2 [Denticeps clupeoides]
MRRAEGWVISESEHESDSAPDGEPGPLKQSRIDPKRGDAGRRSRRTVDADRARAERERRAKEREAVKEEKKREAARLKALRPENCLKRLLLRIHPALLQDERADLLMETLSALGWRTSIDPEGLTHSIMWTRRQPEGEEDEEDEIEEEQVLMVLSLSDFMDVVLSVKQTLLGNPGICGVSPLLNAVSDHLNTHLRSMVTMLVTGFALWNDCHDYVQSQLDMQNEDIEEVMVYLQLQKNVCVRFLNSWQEVTEHVCALTKALSKRPFKELTECADLPFCVDGSWAGGVRVERDGKGLSAVWSRQVQQLNRISPVVAAVVTKAYPSPRLLQQAFEKAESEKARRGLLAELSVSSRARDRHVGPDISARLYRFLTTQNPQMVLD